MQLLLSILSVLGLTLARGRAAAAIIEGVGKFYLSRSLVQQKLVKWVGGALATGEIVNALEDEINWIKEGVREYLENMLGQVINEIDKANIMEAAGKAAAEELAERILEKYGITFPIKNLLSETIAEELGEWFADIVNIQISKKVGYEVEPFTTLFPMEKIVPEFDAFVTEGLNNALGTDIESVFDFPQLKSQIESAVFTRITDIVNERFMIVKSDIMQGIAAEIDGLELPEETKPIISAIITDKLNNLALNLNTVLPTGIKAKKFYFKPTSRLYNKLRQQKYRKTHRQVSQWIEKGAVSPLVQ